MSSRPAPETGRKRILGRLFRRSGLIPFFQPCYPKSSRMAMNRGIVYRSGLAMLFCFCLGSLQAQQTIFSVPSADITDKGSVYLEHESQFRTWQPGRYWFGTDYFAAGLGYDTEVDVTLYNTSAPASGNVSAGVGFRSVFPLLEATQKSTELKWTVGGQALVSFEGRGV